MRIGVIGGGHGCYAAAADLVEKGHRVRLWRRDEAAFDSLRQAGALTGPTIAARAASRWATAPASWNWRLTWAPRQTARNCW